MKARIVNLLSIFLILGFFATPSQALLGGTNKLPDFTELVEENSAAVVNISTTQKISRDHGMPRGFEGMPEFPEGSPFGDFFERFFGERGEGPGPGPDEEFDSQSLGSGFIISSDGYIVTNYHVVKDAEEITVRLSDRRELKAEIIGSDKRSDMALLKVEATDLPVVTIGDSENLKVGEWAMAIGSPFGFDHSVSVGVISAINRSLPRENYVPFIQTDVAINPGNSGGPLFNLDGEVIGINSQILTRSGGFMGLSFAIPIDVAMGVVEQLKSDGKVSRGWLGILIQDVNRELAESFGMKKPMGAVVLQVVPDSPADKAGFREGDVVVEFAGKTIHRQSDLPLAVASYPVGKEAKVKIIREGKKRTLTVKTGELPPEEELAQASPEQPSSDGESTTLGMVLQDLTPEQRKKLDLDERGVLVKEVREGAAAEGDIRPGDVILMINHENITSREQFEKLAGDLPRGKLLPMLVQRGKQPLFMTIRLEE
ncbi:DegQ family serine endoprotease [Thiohalophilus thiocyanatoxydans]|uniref:Probable periplasmic serine endoprotease DegP-like n=1 Tax=Thiohalophilus thiocyanatoxydans TaxID=381308 RepID=A0A4R8IQY2_9GAMM|nr:DegQ family serine endoprotease [Thiohalophilus thiocyanatoxydans]TDY02988.1 serine protease Do [Thiohalophilus thiocyanatoxydans]